jgi:aspartate/methionine/tyrosine aminotransferase
MTADMSAPPARRATAFGTSIFTEISALAVEHGAVNLGQGFPDFPAPAFIKDAAVRAIRDDRNQYAPAAGLPRLREALADRWRRLHGASADAATEVTVASGATELLHDAVLALIEPGDEVIVFEPTYDAYVPDVIMAGGTARAVKLHPPEWRWDPDELRRAFGPRTRAVILNTPHNPTGKVFTRAELEELAGLCRAHDVVVISDEVYSELTFDGAPHVPIATLPGMRQRTITIDSMGKTFSVTGWKVGWAIAPEPLTNALRAIHQFVTFTNSVPFQEALADALIIAESSGYYAELRAAYAARRERLARALEAAGLRPLPAHGAYFLLCDVASVGFPDDVAFCRHLCTEVGVAAIPTSVFYADPTTAPPFARFCFAKRDETIDAAATRLQKLRPPR